MPQNIVVGQRRERRRQVRRQVRRHEGRRVPCSTTAGGSGARPGARPVLDLRLIRRDPDAVRAALARRGGDVAERVDRVLELDARWRELTQGLEALRAEQNAASEGRRGAPDATRSARRWPSSSARGRALSDERGGASSASSTPPLASLPEPPGPRRPAAGHRPARGRRVRPRRASDHLELAGERIDMERGARLSGSRFAYLRATSSCSSSRSSRYALRPAAPRRASSRSSRRCSCASRRCSGPASCPTPSSRSTACPTTSSTSSAPRRSRWRRCTPARSSTRLPAPLRRLLAVLPARGGRRGQGHARDLPRAPVRQGRDVLVRRARGLRGRARAAPRDRGAHPAASSRSPTAW